MRSLACALAAVALTGCGTADAGATLVVSAAASLTDAFTEVVAAFESRHPELDVHLDLAGSQQLVGRALAGEAGDAIALADEVQAARLADAGLVASTWLFATNELVIVVERGDPHDIDGLPALADPALTVVLAAPEVPAGRYARQALEAAGVVVEPDSLEVDVRAVLSKVRLGEADAGIVYATDAAVARDDVDTVPISTGPGSRARYPIVVSPGERAASARRFVDFVLGADGQAILADHGFGPP